MLPKNKFSSLIIYSIIAFLLLFIGFVLGTFYSELKMKALQGDAISMDDPIIPLYLLEDLVEKGDTVAYESLRLAYKDHKHNAFLPFALRLANEYDYTQAYFDVYFHLLKWTGDPTTTLLIDGSDERTKKMAFEYLKLAYEKGNLKAIKELGQLYYYGNFLPKDTVLGKKLIMKYDSLFQLSF